MVEQIYQEFKNKSVYKKIIKLSICGYGIYFALMLLLVVYSAINNMKIDEKSSIYFFIVSIFVCAAINLIFLGIGIIHIMKIRGFIRIIRFYSNSNFNSEIIKYYTENDKSLFKEILLEYGIDKEEKLRFLIERFEKKNINKKMDILTLIPIISLVISLVSFFGGSVNVTVVDKINNFMAVILIILAPIILRKAISYGIKRSYSKKTFDQYFNELVINEYLSR